MSYVDECFYCQERGGFHKHDCRFLMMALEKPANPLQAAGEQLERMAMRAANCVSYGLYFDAKCPTCVSESRIDASPLAVQVGGDHYKKMAIQPVEYIHANSIPFIEGSVIKYVSRWRDKGGVKDLEKAKHFIELLIELEQKGAARGEDKPS